MTDRPFVMRGDVWLVAWDPIVGSEQSKTRPCVIIQRDAASRSRRTTIVVPFTDALTQKMFGITNPLVRAGDGGLAKDSSGLCQQVRAIDRLRLRGPKLGSLTPTSMAAIELGLIEILDLGARLED